MSKQVVIRNGYEIRDMLKTYGGTFRSSDKAWLLSQAGYTRLVALASNPSAGMAFSRGYAKINAYSEI